MTAPAPTLSATRRPHIVWLDVMRLVAILMVVICHCTDRSTLRPKPRSNPDIGFWGAVWGAAVRACVPLFVMITGALLLPSAKRPEPSIKNAYRAFCGHF